MTVPKASDMDKVLLDIPAPANTMGGGAENLATGKIQNTAPVSAISNKQSEPPLRPQAL